MADSPLAALAVFAAYAIGGLAVFPITVLVVVTGIVFGPLVGGVYAYGGVLLNAAVAYWVGRRLGRHTVRQIAGQRLNRITRRLARQGVFAVALIRLLPVASFWKTNVVAGASYVRWRAFLIGTAVGVAPGVALTVIFVDRADAAINHPGPDTFALLAMITAVLVGSALFVWRRFGRSSAP